MNSAGRTWFISAFAAMILVIVLAENVLMWPIPYLGFELYPQTYYVAHVETGSTSERAGMQVGDRVVRMYDHPMSEVYNSVTHIGWIPPRHQPVPVVVEREGDIMALQLAQDPPSRKERVSQLALAGLALLCWLTGYVIGIGRYQTVLESRAVAYFWLSMGGVLGSVQFAGAVSLPLLAVLAWLVISVLLPLAVYMHLFFPPRLYTPTQVARARWYLLGGMVVLNASLLASFAVRQPSMIEVLAVLLRVLPVSLVAGLGGSAILLWRAYRRTTVAHTRRQIRLIATACSFVACAWLVLQVIPTLTLGDRLVPRNVLFLTCGLVPLAYLSGTVTPDLYRIDRLARRCLEHVLTFTIVGSLLLTLGARLGLNGVLATLLLALCFVVLYRPVQHMVSLVLGGNRTFAQQQAAVDRTTTELTQTLDQQRLVKTLAEGIRVLFEQPALAVFVGDVNGSNELRLSTHERLEGLPATLTAGTLTRLLHDVDVPIDGRSMYWATRAAPLTPEEQQILGHPNISLWGPIRHSDGHFLGLLVLGMRGDLEPYRSEDHAVVQRLLSAAALAFTNSASYVQQQESELQMRHLYRRLQTARDTAARELAQELHDDIINVHVRLNIRSLHDIAARNRDPVLHNEIALVLESLCTMSDDLRRICEELYPTGLHDVFGLGAVLRAQVQKEQARWNGHCQFEEIGEPRAIAAPVQREALRITKEAVMNAVKHARASTISVQLRYPAIHHEAVRLTVSDDGHTTQAIYERDGHLGIPYMRESANAVGGTLNIEHQLGKGTTITFTFMPNAKHCE